MEDGSGPTAPLTVPKPAAMTDETNERPGFLKNPGLFLSPGCPGALHLRFGPLGPGRPYGALRITSGR
jgi:hypothetical protein